MTEICCYLAESAHFLQAAMKMLETEMEKLIITSRKHILGM